MTPIVTHPGEEIILPLALAGPASRYALLASYGRARIACGAPWNKRDKQFRRLVIADAAGRLQLTLPVEHPEHIAGTRLSDLRVSGHGGWWNVMMTALESAYGRTPYFEFYQDRLRPIISEQAVGFPLMDFCARLDGEIAAMLGLDTEILYDPDTVAPPMPQLPELIYPQHRERELGFIPATSILDLIFCHGPEAPLLMAGYNRTRFCQPL